MNCALRYMNCSSSIALRALKECFETEYWLDVFTDSGIVEKAEYNTLCAMNSKLRKMLTASIKTAKNNTNSEAGQK